MIDLNMKKRHRIFIAINLPQDIKKMLAKYQEKWPQLPAKWVPENNLHITTVFLGDLTDIELGEVCMTAKEVVVRHAAIDVNLKTIGYGPEGKVPPRMLWASGEKSKELSLLKKELEEALLGKVRFVLENKAFALHITLAKISAFGWRAIEPEERPELPESIDLLFTVESIEVMESELKKGRPEYTIIESVELSR